MYICSEYILWKFHKLTSNFFQVKIIQIFVVVPFINLWLLLYIYIYIYIYWVNYGLCSWVIKHSIPGSVEPFVLRQTRAWIDYWLSCFDLSPDNNHENFESDIRVAQALASMVPWYTNLRFRSIYLPTFISKKSYGDGNVPKYADLIGKKYAVIYKHMGDRSPFPISLLCPCVCVCVCVCV